MRGSGVGLRWNWIELWSAKLWETDLSWKKGGGGVKWGEESLNINITVIRLWIWVQSDWRRVQCRLRCAKFDWVIDSMWHSILIHCANMCNLLLSSFRICSLCNMSFLWVIRPSGGVCVGGAVKEHNLANWKVNICKAFRRVNGYCWQEAV